MANANIPRIRGDDYQARTFWLRACGLFQGGTRVQRVALEQYGVKTFDDVVVYYDGTMIDEDGRRLDGDYLQVKFHVTGQGSFTARAMTDPAFINAESVSLLQRLRVAQLAHAPDGYGARFLLLKPWQILPSDPLAKLVMNENGRLRLDLLFSGGSRSEMGKVRALWRKHLTLATDEELRPIVRPLRLIGSPDLVELTQQLNIALVDAGLTRVDEGGYLNQYDDLARKLMTSGQREFDRAAMENVLKQANLWRGGPLPVENAVRVGIRAFTHGTLQLPAQNQHFLDLTDHFDGRRLRHDRSWAEHVYPRIGVFLTDAVDGNRRCFLTIAAHSSIAFAAGYHLNSKFGVEVLLQQPTGNGDMRTWRFDDPHLEADVPNVPWIVEEVRIGDGRDVAVALSLTHRIADEVRLFVNQALPNVGHVIHCAPANGHGFSAVTDGSHARRLAEELGTILRERRSIEERSATLHIFSAAPNAFTFSLGRIARSLGRVLLYEHDFDSGAPAAYAPSLMFPSI